MRIMGLDLSLVETGIFVLDGDKEVARELITSKPKEDVPEVQRILSIAERIFYYITRYRPDKVIIEGLSFGSKNSRSLCTLAKLNFQIEVYCFLDKIPYLIVPPTTLKKFITGKGNAKKEIMLMKILKRYGLEFENDNLADAYGLCRYGESLTLEVRKNGD